MNEMWADFLAKPARFDRHGRVYDKRQAQMLIMVDMLEGNYFTTRVTTMTKDIDNATQLIVDAMDRFEKALDRFIALETKVINASKQASRSVRSAHDDMASGLSRVEKTANFDRLDTYVGLLERASVSMKALAELEASGKLEKIAGALK